VTNALANNCGEHPSGANIETAFGYGFQGRMDRVGATAVEMRNHWRARTGGASNVTFLKCCCR